MPTGSQKPAPAQPAASTKRRTRAKPRTRRPGPWNVVLLDDDHHTYEYVIRMMQSIFGHPPEKGYQIACRVDEDGRAVCLTTHKEHAELKRDQIHAFGKDPLMAQSRGSMSAIIEPAEQGDDRGPPGRTPRGPGPKP